MRTLLIGALFATLIGCSCPTPPHAMLEGCTSKGCLYRTAASPPIELKPAPPIKPNRATTKVRSKQTAMTAKSSSVAAKAANLSTAQPSTASNEHKTDSPIVMSSEFAAPGLSTEKAKTTIATKVDAPPSGRPPEASDPVLKKAKTTVAARMEDPASAEFEDMKRSIKKNTFGLSFDIICGHVKGKKTSGEATGERAFLYLVMENEAFIVDGNPDSVAAIAYRAHCSSPDLHGQNLR